MALYIKGIYVVNDETTLMRHLTKRKDLHFYYAVDKTLWEDKTPIIATGKPLQEGDLIEGEVEYSHDNGVSFLILIKTLERYKYAHQSHCCVEHGCVYGDGENCPVVSGEIKQLYPCIDCERETMLAPENEIVLVPEIAGSVKVKVGEIKELKFVTNEEEETDE